MNLHRLLCRSSLRPHDPVDRCDPYPQFLGGLDLGLSLGNLSNDIGRLRQPSTSTRIVFAFTLSPLCTGRPKHKTSDWTTAQAR